ncbi:MAG: transposase, partial [bacterium]|nr:transposase [bacterium]
RESKNRFIIPLLDEKLEGQHRDRATLVPIIRKYIKPGSIIYSDSWGAYNTLDEEGYTHHIINHSQHFVDPEDQSNYTQTVERLNERPLTGWGIQGRPGERSRYLRLGTHSEALNVAYRFGWVGLALLALAAWFYSRRLVWRATCRPEGAALVLAVAALGLTALVRTFQWDLNVFWLVMAFLGTSAARPSRAAGDEPPSEIAMLGARLHPQTMDQLHGEIALAVAS